MGAACAGDTDLLHKFQVPEPGQTRCPTSVARQAVPEHKAACDSGPRDRPGGARGGLLRLRALERSDSHAAGRPDQRARGTCGGHGRARHSPLLPGLGLQHPAGTAERAPGQGRAGPPLRPASGAGGDPGAETPGTSRGRASLFGFLREPAPAARRLLTRVPSRSQDVTATRPGPQPSPPLPYPEAGSCGHVEGKCSEEPGDPRSCHGHRMTGTRRNSTSVRLGSRQTGRRAHRHNQRPGTASLLGTCFF